MRGESSDGEERKKPTPVRAMAAAEAPSSPVKPDAEEVGITVRDVDWLVRVVGRSGGSRPSATPLLLLGFWKRDSVDGEREREALVVGRALAELSPDQLEAAFEDSHVPPEPPTESAAPGKARRHPRTGGPGRHR